MLKRTANEKTGEITFAVSSVKEAEEAVQLMQERNEAIAEVEAMMEEEYELSTLRKESMALYEAVRAFVLKRNKDLIMDDRTWKIVKPASRSWNPDKLMKLLPKSLFMKVATMSYTIDPERLDSLIREGSIDRKKIATAFEETPKTPYVKHTVLKEEDTTGEDEADAVAAALDS